MSNLEIIKELMSNEIIHKADGVWIVEFPAGGEEISDDGFSCNVICDMYREQQKV